MIIQEFPNSHTDFCDKTIASRIRSYQQGKNKGRKAPAPGDFLFSKSKIP
jgi:hypothetical protein